MKKISVTVGIAAHNEEKNIKNILRGILGQRQTNWILEKVFVASDGSTDHTVQNAKSIKSAKIKVIESRERLGKVGVEQIIFDSFASEILVMLDADVKLEDNLVITKLVEKLFSDEKVMLVGGNTRPFAPKTFFEKAVYSTFQVFDDSRGFVKNGNNIFGCNGGCLAIKAKLAKQIEFPNLINEDDYIYFSCIAKGYKFRYVQEAVVYYKLPNNLKDYLRQIFRSNPEAVSQNISKYFGKIVDEEYYRPFFFYFRSIMRAFLANPLGTVYITFINILTKPFFPFISKKYKLSWHTAISTK